jgi:hypothetical protein
MDKKIIIMLMFICVITSVYAATSATRYDWPNMLGPATDQAINALTLGWVSLKYDDFKEGIFYPISQWEFDVCSSKVTDDLSSSSFAGQMGDSMDIKDLYGPITAAINGKKVIYQVNNSQQTLYEISWYVQPKPYTQDIKYSIYLMSDNGQKYYPNSLKGLTADPAQGATGDYTAYLEESGYTEVGIESSGNVVFKNVIVNNTAGENYG